LQEEDVMACKLKRDPSGRCNFTGKAEEEKPVTVTVSAKSGDAGIVSALLNGEELEVENNDTVQFQIASGFNELRLGILAPPDDIVQLLEGCGSGKTQVLRKYKNIINPRTGAPDPLTGFTVWGS
jgi:hypothetical protein